MQYRSFGKLAWKVSEIGLGSWAMGSDWGPQDDSDSLATLNRAIDLGVNFFDTAQVYGQGHSEGLIGRVIKERAVSQQVFVATKITPRKGPWPPSPYCKIGERFPGDYLREQTEISLRNLGRDHIDVMQLHTWSRAWNDDTAWLETMRSLVKEGKIRAIGISTPTIDQDSVNDLFATGVLDSVQVIFNIFQQRPAAQLLALAQRCGVGVIVRCPFDESSLTGKLTNETTFPKGDFRKRYFRGERLVETVKRVEEIRMAIGDEYESMAAAALKFCLNHTAVSVVIPGMRTLSQAEQNCSASDLPDMSDTLYAKLKKHYWDK